MLRLIIITLAVVLMTSVVKADLNPGDVLPNPTLRAQDGKESTLYDLCKKITVLHLWKCNWPQCRAEMPHLRKMMEEFKDQPVSFLSVNTRDPDGKVDAEIKQFKMTQPIHYGRGQDINENFKVKKLPRLIFVREDKTVHKDIIFLDEEELRYEIKMLLKEAASDSLKKSSAGVNGAKGKN